MSADGHRNKWRRNIAENFNRLSMVHERYRRQTDGRTDGRQHIAKNAHNLRNTQSIMVQLVQ